MKLVCNREERLRNSSVSKLRIVSRIKRTIFFHLLGSLDTRRIAKASASSNADWTFGSDGFEA